MSSIEINDKLTFIYSYLMESEVDNKLYKIIDKPLQKLANITQDDRLTYKNLIYHQMLLQEIYTSLKNDASVPSNELLIEILYKLNFNSIDLFHYLTTRIEKEAGLKETSAEKKALLYHYQKVYKQWLVKTNVMYQNSLIPLRAQILTWIKEEIFFLKKLLTAA